MVKTDKIVVKMEFDVQAKRRNRKSGKKVIRKFFVKKCPHPEENLCTRLMEIPFIQIINILVIVLIRLVGLTLIYNNC